MTELWVTLVWALGPPAVGVAGLAVRLRWQARREQQRQRTVRALAGAVRVSGAVESGAVEIEDVRGDGSRLTVRITPSTSGERLGR